MKKINKIRGRKGFTLVETMLGVFILVVVSTMLINGFITTMAYSFQTSVYSMSGSTNYNACMNKVSGWSHLQNTGSTGREVMAINAGYTSSGGHKTLNFVHGGNSLESLYVAEISRNTLSLTVPTQVRYESNNYTPDDSTYNAYVDNHKSLVYFPEYCSNGTEASKGKIVVKYDSDAGLYYWVVDNGNPTLNGATVVGSGFN